MTLKGRKIVVDSEENSKFADDFYSKEQKRALINLASADSFVLISHDKAGGGDVISCIMGDNLIPMAIATKRISKDLDKMIGELITNKGKE